MYWSDWNHMAIEKANRFTGSNRTVLVNVTHRPMTVRVVHPLRQRQGQFRCCYSSERFSVLFFSRPRSEGWPHHERTFYVIFPVEYAAIRSRCMARVITHADSRGTFFWSICVCLYVFFTRYLKNRSNYATMITKLDVEMYRHDSWKPIYFAVKRSKFKVTRHKKTVPAWVFALL